MPMPCLHPMLPVTQICRPFRQNTTTSEICSVTLKPRSYRLTVNMTTRSSSTIPMPCRLLGQCIQSHRLSNSKSYENIASKTSIRDTFATPNRHVEPPSSSSKSQTEHYVFVSTIADSTNSLRKIVAHSPR